MLEHIYPAPEHTVYMKDNELVAFVKAIEWESTLIKLDKSNYLTMGVDDKNQDNKEK